MYYWSVLQTATYCYLWKIPNQNSNVWNLCFDTRIKMVWMMFGYHRSFKGSLFVVRHRKSLAVLCFFSVCLMLCTELDLAIPSFVHATLARALLIKNICLWLYGPLTVRINVLMWKTSTVILLIIYVVILFILVWVLRAISES